MNAGWVKVLRALCIVFALLGAGAAQAGRSCEVRQVEAEALQKAVHLAAKAQDLLEHSGAQLALIARVGRDLSKFGLRYSHFAFVWRDHPDGRWMVMHKLNNCGTAYGDLYAEGLANFFADDLFAHDGWIVIPKEPLQTRLVATLQRDQGVAFHQRRYSVVAYPFSTKYQNSNQWGLEILASAMSASASIVDRAGAQAWLRTNGYAPTRLTLGPLTRLGGRMFKANVAFDDHPPELRWSNRIDTVTVESVFAFVMMKDAAMSSVQFKL